MERGDIPASSFAAPLNKKRRINASSKSDALTQLAIAAVKRKREPSITVPVLRARVSEQEPDTCTNSGERVELTVQTTNDWPLDKKRARTGQW